MRVLRVVAFKLSLGVFLCPTDISPSWPEVVVDWQVINPGQQLTYWASESILTISWSIQSFYQMLYLQLIGLLHADGREGLLSQHFL